MISYPGSKTNTGIIQFLINNIPHHRVYMELFFGSGALFHAKKPAEISFINDINKKVINSYGARQKGVYISNSDAGYLIAGNVYDRSHFIYLDPPYPMDSRRSGAKIYKNEMTDDDHVQLLSAVLQTDANVMISTRQNNLYSSMLAGWRCLSFQVMDRAGVNNELIYMNYDAPALLHQYDYVGNGYIDRQRINRKIERFKQKLDALPGYEKHLFMQAMIQDDYLALQHFMSMVPGVATTDENNYAAGLQP